MNRRFLFSWLLSFVVVAAASAAPIKLARHPDYHAGKIVFSYFGDLWIANEDGSGARRITDHTARDIYPRFSPDGKWIAFSSNRYGNNDVFIIPTDGGTAKQLTYHSGNDEVVGWTRDSRSVVFRAPRGLGAFPNVATLHTVAVDGGMEQPLPTDWGWSGSFSPDGKSLVFNRHPSTWSRRHYRGSYAADLWITNLADKTYTRLLPDEKYNRYWPMWGADDNIYFVGDPLPNEKNVKPGSPDVRLSVNNIYRISAKGGPPVQVTKHADGSLFWPSMSSDGKTIVYEDDFGIWKLDVASGRTSEIKIELGTDYKDNQIEFATVSDEVDAFDISPSGRRAAISARGQILTIATDRGDITRVNPDRMASRSQTPKWSADGKYIAFVSDRSGRDEIWISDPEGRTPKKITDLDNEKVAPIWSPDSKSLLYIAGGKQLYNYTVDDGKTTVVTKNDIGRIGSVAVSPDSKWITVAKQDRTLRSHIYILPIGGGEERHISDDALMFAENEAVWTADGQYILFTSTEGFSNGIATQGGITASTELWVLALRDRDRDPGNRDIDNEAQGLAAQAEARRNTAGGTTTPVVQIDWSGLPRRAKQLTVPGNNIGSLTPGEEGAFVALTIGQRAAGGGGGQGGGAGDMYVINVESGQLTRVPRAPQNTDAGAGNQGGGGGGFGAGPDFVFARDGRTLYFRSGNGENSALYAATINLQQASQNPRAGGGRGNIEEPTGANATARKVTYTANLEIDHKALRAQIFNEGWRIMKNRFYDANMHGTPWNEMRSIYAPLLENLVDDEELHVVMMMMIGRLNASHTGVAGPAGNNRGNAQTRYPGFDLVADASGYYKVGRLYKDGPAGKDYLKIKEGQFIIALDDRELKTTDNYWQRFTYPLGQKFHFLLNDKPTRAGAWEVTITPVTNQAFADLQYDRWVADRGEIVAKASNGEIGYLHIRAMDAPSLRRFQLDLASNRTKKALVIDQRFNGGGGIDQELLGILSGRRYQYTQGRDAGFEQPRPQNFYGPMVVMQNERSASDAEMFPAGFKALGLGKTVGVPTMGAVIGTGSYTLLDGSTIRTPGSGVWTSEGINMENYGVPPDVFVDNLPADFFRGRDAQLEKAVEVLKEQLAKPRTSTQQQ
ncbi:MAG: biopolymer transporter Tol [Cyanobacteria bacterium]|nr:biopolymer transporter Tol [Cyanobacteriota bacterium]